MARHLLEVHWIYKHLVPNIFGIVDKDKTSCCLSWLKDNFEEVSAHLDQNSDEIRKYVIAFMLFVLEIAIIPSKTRKNGIRHIFVRVQS